MAVVFRAGGLAMALPFGGFNPNTDITYTGSHSVIDDGDGDWRIKFTTSGTLTFLKAPGDIDVFLVGGGGGGSNLAGGGGGGYTSTHLKVALSLNTDYIISIAAAGSFNSSGRTTYFDQTGLNYSASGGARETSDDSGSNGGSGGGGYTTYPNGGDGGSDGSDGGNTNGGDGQGTTTREFGDETGDLYAGGGGAWPAGAGGAGGGGAAQTSGTPNTGGGAGGGGGSPSPTGGTGIVVMRNHRAA